MRKMILALAALALSQPVTAQVSFSNLPAVSPTLDGTEIAPITPGATTRHTTAQRIANTAASVTGTLPLTNLPTNTAAAAVAAHAATNAMLTGMSSALGRAVRDGYTALGDVEPLTYIASASACSLNSGAGDGGSQIPTSDSKCWIATFPGTGFDVRQFGATGNGTTNDTVAVQRTINYACSTRSSSTGYLGGTVRLPKGAYLLNGGVTIPAACPGLFIKGDGIGSSAGTYIVSDHACSAPIIDFYSNATQNYIYGGGVSDVYFFNNKLSGGTFDGAASCAQPLIRASYARNMLFEHIAVLSPKIFIKLIAGMNNTVRDISIDQAIQNSTGVFEFMGSGAHPDATGQFARQDGINLDNVTVFGAAASRGNQWYVGVWNHGLSQTVRITKAAFENASIALKVDCTNPGVSSGLLAAEIGACPGNSFVYDLETECAGSNCISLTDTQSWHFSQPYVACFARTSTSTPATSGCSNAVNISNSMFTTTGDISLIGGQLNGAQASCLDNGGWQLSVTGMVTHGCNAANVGGADYTIEAPGSNLGGSNSIVNNRMCTGPADNSLKENGIKIIAGSDYNTISLNNWKGCGSGIIGKFGSHSVVVNNIGP